jgi:hypothetical protein
MTADQQRPGHQPINDGASPEIPTTGSGVKPRAPQVARHGAAPGYWMYETSGVLRPAIVAYLEHDELTPTEIAAIRAYLRQWVNAPGFQGADVEELRASVDGLTSRQAIGRWLDEATHAGIDPL